MLMKARALLTTFAAILACSTSSLSAAEIKAGGPWKVGEVTIEAAWARMVPGQPDKAVVYLTVNNKAEVSDLLFSAHSTDAKLSSIQEFSATKGESKARDLPFGMPLDPKQELVMSPGKTQILLQGVAASLPSKARVPMKVIFHNAGTIVIEVPIIPASEAQPRRLHSGHA